METYDAKKGIEENFKRLNVIVKFFKDFEFYSLECTFSTVYLQGHFNSDLVVFTIKHKFNASITENGFIKLERRINRYSDLKKYVITLT